MREQQPSTLIRESGDVFYAATLRIQTTCCIGAFFSFTNPVMQQRKSLYLRPVNDGIYAIHQVQGSVLLHGTCKCQSSKTHGIIKLFICHFLLRKVI